MDNIEIFFEDIGYNNIIESIIIIIINVIIYKILIHFLSKGEREDSRFKLFTSKKSKTYLRLLKSLFRYAFIIITVLLLLQINGVDVSSALAGIGIVGVVLGIAIQDWLKDIIRGSSILSDNYFSVGDVVKYKEIEGKVIIVGLKTTKIQDLKTSNIISIANRNIEEIELVSNIIYINIPMPYETSLEKAEKTIEDIILNIKQNENVEDCKYKGVNELDNSSIKYLLEVTCSPVYKLQVRRDALRSILEEMKNNGIEVPYTQIDIHQK